MSTLAFCPNDKKEQLEAKKAALLSQIAELDTKEPQNRNCEQYEDWADKHEELEDLLDDVQDLLDDLED